MVNFKKDNKDITALKDDLKNGLLVSEVFERYQGEVTKNGNYTMALCPFHGDTNLGSFYINDNKKTFKCYGCGTSGDIIELVKNRYGCEYLDAVFILARDYGYISQEEFDSQDVKFDKNYESVKLEKIKKAKKATISLEAPLRDESTIEKVYSIFANLSPLTNKDKDYLINTRKLPEEKVEKDYFTMPLCTQGFMRKLIAELKVNGFTEEDLIGVPGFYFDEKKNRIAFKGARGIGIKIRGAEGNFKRIQVRLSTLRVNKNTGKAMRYWWFSSLGEVKGCGSGSPVDVSYPNLPVEHIKAVGFLTEGKFKSERINEYYSSVSLSVQGITSWKNKIVPEIKGVQKNVTIKGIFICYDADMAINPQVFIQCKQMVESELHQLFIDRNIYIVIWDQALGKGIDDLIDSGNKDAIKKIIFSEYVKIYETKFLSKYDIDKKGNFICKKTNLIKTKEELYKDYMESVFSNIK